ncbi:MAG: TetR family transcriptional regulator C-terminal domain-containing protein [Gammaproteobacteria bacterium]
MSTAAFAARRTPDATRQKLLERAFEEIHRNGFRAASLDSILADAGVTKGALYHHFGSKTELGYAVVEEVVRPWMEQVWMPVTLAEDPIDAAIAVIHQRLRERSEMALTIGCPFNNLTQEMSAIDEGFRKRLSAILHDWRDATAAAMRRGQANGTVCADVDPRAAAAFVISSVEGCVGMAKASQSREFLEAGFRGLIEYLEHLRPQAHRTAPPGDAQR